MGDVSFFPLAVVENAWARLSHDPDYQRHVTSFFKSQNFCVNRSGLFAGTDKSTGRRQLYCDGDCVEQLATELASLLGTALEAPAQAPPAADSMPKDVQPLSFQSVDEVKSFFKELKRAARQARQGRQLSAAQALLLSARRWTAPFSPEELPAAAAVHGAPLQRSAPVAAGPATASAAGEKGTRCGCAAAASAGSSGACAGGTAAAAVVRVAGHEGCRSGEGYAARGAREGGQRAPHAALLHSHPVGGAEQGWGDAEEGGGDGRCGEGCCRAAGEPPASAAGAAAAADGSTSAAAAAPVPDCAAAGGGGALRALRCSAQAGTPQAAGTAHLGHTATCDGPADGSGAADSGLASRADSGAPTWPAWPPATPRCAAVTCAAATAATAGTAFWNDESDSDAGGATPCGRHAGAALGASLAVATAAGPDGPAGGVGGCGAVGALVVCCCVDLEWWERDSSRVTEIGWTMWDNFTRRLESRHHIVSENEALVNRIHVPDHKRCFLFGASVTGPLAEGAAALQDDLLHYGRRVWAGWCEGRRRAGEASEAEPEAAEALEEPVAPPMQLVLVGHGMAGDLKALSTLLGVTLPPGTAILDTADLAWAALGGGAAQDRAISLRLLLKMLGINATKLHNGGNDARYTMEAMLALAALTSNPSE